MLKKYEAILKKILKSTSTENFQKAAIKNGKQIIINGYLMVINDNPTDNIPTFEKNPDWADGNIVETQQIERNHSFIMPYTLEQMKKAAKIKGKSTYWTGMTTQICTGKFAVGINLTFICWAMELTKSNEFKFSVDRPHSSIEISGNKFTIYIMPVIDQIDENTNRTMRHNNIADIETTIIFDDNGNVHDWIN